MYTGTYNINVPGSEGTLYKLINVISFCGFLLGFLNSRSLWKGVYSIRKEFFPYRIDPFSEGRQNQWPLWNIFTRRQLLWLPVRLPAQVPSENGSSLKGKSLSFWDWPFFGRDTKRFDRVISPESVRPPRPAPPPSAHYQYLMRNSDKNLGQDPIIWCLLKHAYFLYGEISYKAVVSYISQVAKTCLQAYANCACLEKTARMYSLLWTCAVRPVYSAHTQYVYVRTCFATTQFVSCS